MSPKPWAKVEIGYMDHPKFLALSGNAISLWHEGKNYCDKFNTDGLIPRDALKLFRFAGKKSIDMLTVSCSTPKPDGSPYAPLWEVHLVGYRMHDYLDHNDCRDAVLARMEHADERRQTERDRKAEWRAKKAEKAGMSRGTKNGTATSLSRSTTAPAPETESTTPNGVVSAEASSPPLLVFPTVGQSSTWGLSSVQVAEWQALFPNVDVMHEMRKAVAWCHANPVKRKTAKGMPRCLVSWLSGAVDNPRTRSSAVVHRHAEQAPAHAPWECPHVEEHAAQATCAIATKLGRPRRDDAKAPAS